MNIDTKKLVQTEFLAFAMKAFATLNKGRSLGNDKYLKLLAREPTRVAVGETKRLVVSMPPRHCKTFMGSICLPAWILANNPSAKIVILTYGQDLADKTAYAVRNILRSEWYQQAFHTRLKKDRAKLMDFVTADGGGVRSLSNEGGVTGHPDHEHATRAALVTAARLDLPVLAWTVLEPVAAKLNAEFATAFVGRSSDQVDLTLTVDRARQLTAVACHRTQSHDNPVLWRRLELTGNREPLRWLRPSGSTSSRPV